MKKLVALGATDKGEEKLEETIFHPADGSWIGKRKFVRLRRTKGKTKLTYKENVEQAVDSAQEIELEVSDAEQCSEFLAKVGLKPMRQIEKYRHTLELGDVTIDIDTWPKVPAYAEMEGRRWSPLKRPAKSLAWIGKSASTATHEKCFGAMAMIWIKLP